MKTKILSIIIAIIAIFTVFTVAYADNTPNVEPESESASDEVIDGAIEFDESKFGDVNNDGKRSAADARLLLRVSAQLENNSVYILTYGDYNKDGQITAADARTALRVSAQLENIECILHGHDIIEVIIEPTCTEGGYTTNRCSRCLYTDGTKTNKTNAAGHSFIVSKTVSATCTAKGYTVYECKTCGAVEHRNETDMKSHNMVASKTVKATCTTEGYTEYKCSVCGYTEKRDVVATTGHKYEYVSKEFYETSNFVGYKAVKKCAYCNKKIITYDVRGGNTQIETQLIYSKQAKAIQEKFEYYTDMVEGYDITGKKVVIYNNLRGIDIDGYFYNLDGTLMNKCERCGKIAGMGEGMCSLMFCGITFN